MANNELTLTDAREILGLRNVYEPEQSGGLLGLTEIPKEMPLPYSKDILSRCALANKLNKRHYVLLGYPGLSVSKVCQKGKRGTNICYHIIDPQWLKKEMAHPEPDTCWALKKSPVGYYLFDARPRSLDYFDRDDQNKILIRDNLLRLPLDVFMASMIILDKIVGANPFHNSWHWSDEADTTGNFIAVQKINHGFNFQASTVNSQKNFNICLQVPWPKT